MKKFFDILYKIGLLLIIPTFLISYYSYRQSKETFKVQNTPRLTANSPGKIYVGRIQNRTDEIVNVPITVFNSSDAFAYDVVLNLLFSDGTGRKVNINDYLKSVNAPIQQLERLGKGGIWSTGFSPSAPNNAEKIYLANEKKFKIKIQLKWKDAKGKEYRFLELAELTPTKTIEGMAPQFWFKSKGSYSSIDDIKEINKYWNNMDFDF